MILEKVGCISHIVKVGADTDAWHIYIYILISLQRS